MTVAEEQIDTLRAELAGLTGGSRLGPLVRLGQALADRYWRRGIGRPAGLADLDEAIERMEEAYGHARADDAYRGTTAAYAGWFRCARYAGHGEADDDRETGLRMLEVALATPNLNPMMRTMSLVWAGQLYFGRVAVFLQAPGAMMNLMTGQAPAEVVTQADRAAECLREVVDGRPVSADLVEGVKAILTMVEIMRGMLRGQGAGMDLGRLMEAMASMQKFQGRFAGPGAASPNPSFLDFGELRNLLRSDVLDRPVMVLREEPPDQPKIVDAEVVEPVPAPTSAPVPPVAGPVSSPAPPVAQPVSAGRPVAEPASSPEASVATEPTPAPPVAESSPSVGRPVAEAVSSVGAPEPTLERDGLRAMVRAALAGEDAGLSGLAALLDPATAAPDVAAVDDAVAIARTVVDLDDGRDSTAEDWFALAVALGLRHRLDPDAEDGDDRTAGLRALHTAVRTLPAADAGTATLLAALGAFLDQSRPFDEPLADVAEEFADRIDAVIVSGGITGAGEFATLHALRCLCRTAVAFSELGRAPVPVEYPWRGALLAAMRTTGL